MTIKTDDDDKVLRDGGRVTISLMMMDSTQRAIAAHPPAIKIDANVGHRPGSLPVRDADRQTRAGLHAKANKVLSERWKNPPSIGVDGAPPIPRTTRPQPATGMAAAYARADERLRSRWKGDAV